MPVASVAPTPQATFQQAAAGAVAAVAAPTDTRHLKRPAAGAGAHYGMTNKFRFVVMFVARAVKHACSCYKNEQGLASSMRRVIVNTKKQYVLNTEYINIEIRAIE